MSKTKTVAMVLPSAPKPDLSECKKVTLHLPGDLDFRLYSIAKKERVSKLKLAIRILDQGLARHGLDEELKGVYAKMMAKAREEGKTLPIAS